MKNSSYETDEKAIPKFKQHDTRICDMLIQAQIVNDWVIQIDYINPTQTRFPLLFKVIELQF